jgi:hypothetical protein
VGTLLLHKIVASVELLVLLEQVEILSRLQNLDLLFVKGLATLIRDRFIESDGIRVLDF